MANPEHLAILKRGVEEWNKWLGENRGTAPDLSRAELPGASLGGVQLTGANLCGANLLNANFSKAQLRMVKLHEANLLNANFSEADLREAEFNWAIIRGASLREARLDEAVFTGARLSEADLGRANLFYADLSGADLSRANLGGANLKAARAGATRFTALDLSTTMGLETVLHRGPSSVGIDTIYKSKGKIPEVFLRGCGVPDDMIAYIRSIAGAVQFYSCFISYSTKDQEFADRLYADLQSKGVRCWFAPHDIHGGRKIHEQIDEAIRLHDKLLLILSESSMASKWVTIELRKALDREAKEGKRVLFPVGLVNFEALKNWEKVDSAGNDLAEEIRQYFIPDFSNWKDHDSYQKAFQRLVSDLKAESRP